MPPPTLARLAAPAAALLARACATEPPASAVRPPAPPAPHALASASFQRMKIGKAYDSQEIQRMYDEGPDVALGPFEAATHPELLQAAGR